MSSPPVHRFIERLWYGGSSVALLLLPLSWLYGAVARVRRRLYRSGWLRSGHPGVPVIVVGNITVGGTGKTPIVAWLVAQLRAEGLRPGVVSRGYGVQAASAPVQVLASSSAGEVGDEPLLLARRTGVPVVICRDRLRGARALVAAGVDVIVADDGMQHYALSRDMEIAVVDGSRRFGNGRLLPAGPLREPVARLAQADLVMVNDGEPDRGWLRFRLQSRMAVALGSGEQRDLASFSGKKIWAVAGIGNPWRFHAELRRCGAEVAPVDVPDHGRTDLGRLRQTADWPILMTEKDAVKYQPCSYPEVWYVPVDVEVSAESAAVASRRLMAVIGNRHG